MIRKASLRAFDPLTYTADVRIVGSLAIDLGAVPVSRAIPAAELIAGRTVALIQFDPTNHRDAMLVGIVG